MICFRFRYLHWHESIRTEQKFSGIYLAVNYFRKARISPNQDHVQNLPSNPLLYTFQEYSYNKNIVKAWTE